MRDTPPDRFNKPWGYEFRNELSEVVTLTYLSIFPGHQTSLHCHPRKTTSLTAISGTGALQFLKDKITFSAGTSFMVRNGLFHQIVNLGEKELIVLEFENPSDPQDLVRLEDGYGRRNLGYETNSEQSEFTHSELSFFKFIRGGGSWEDEDTQMCIQFPGEIKFVPVDQAVYAVLTGGLRDDMTQAFVLREGDCTTGSTIERLTRSFSWVAGSKLLEIRKVG